MKMNINNFYWTRYTLYSFFLILFWYISVIIDSICPMLFFGIVSILQEINFKRIKRGNWIMGFIKNRINAEYKKHYRVTGGLDWARLAEVKILMELRDRGIITKKSYDNYKKWLWGIYKSCLLWYLPNYCLYNR